MDQVTAINWTFKQIIEQGTNAIPAISEFLERSLDVNFAEIGNDIPLEYASLRLGLIGALEQIGGPDALDLTVRTLETTGLPLEVAALTRSLESQAPGDYRAVELEAGREVLAMAVRNQLAGRDLDPVFEIFKAYGDVSIVADLERVVRRTDWKGQAIATLSALPEGASVPALVHLAEDPELRSKDQTALPLQALAQLATRSSDAQNALRDQAHWGNIPDAAWPAVASALAGNQLGLSPDSFPSANDSLKTIPFDEPPVASGNSGTAVLTTEQINERVQLIDELLLGNINPIAIDYLQTARASLLTVRH